jgi:hypothetical protein
LHPVSAPEFWQMMVILMLAGNHPFLILMVMILELPA